MCAQTKKDPIQLTSTDRNTLNQITRSGTRNARVINRARILLQLDLLEMSLEGLVEPTQQPMASPGN
jgi:hypothetical protein